MTATSPSDDPRLAAVTAAEDVFPEYRDTPVGDLLLAQNLGRAFPEREGPCLFTATCIDSRVRLALPPGVSFEHRSAGVNLREAELFQISFAVSVAGVRHLAIISHDDCAMSLLEAKKETFVSGIKECTGWETARAETYFDNHVTRWHRHDPVGAVTDHVKLLRDLFPEICVAPLHYAVGEHKLYQTRMD